MALAPKHLLSVILLLLILAIGQGMLLYRLLHDLQTWQHDHATLGQEWRQLEARFTALQTEVAQSRSLPIPQVAPQIIETLPVGSIIAYAGATPPEHWLSCTGQTLNRAEYPRLYATLMPGATAETFTLPDLRGRTIIGINQEDPDFKMPYQSGGAKSVTLRIENLPPHSHNYWRSQYAGYVYDRFAKGGDKDAKALETPSSTVGEGKPFNNLPPYLTLSFIIRAQ